MHKGGDLNHITATVLAGGFGTRLRGVVSDRPKVLAQIGDKPFLSFIMNQLTTSGVKQVILCTGYLSEQIEQLYGSQYGALNITYSRETDPLGTAGAIRKAADLFDSDFALIMNGDSYCDADLREFWHWHNRKQAEASILLCSVPDAMRYGRVKVGADDRVEAFEEKRPEHEEDWINAGVYIIKRDLIMTIPSEKKMSLENEIFPTWIGRHFFGYQNGGRFLDIGIPEDYDEARDFFSSLNGDRG
ncbi:MAG: nucleotidyltransferase family protein [Candidatus Vecturithrix sp.]|jgi:NDP-sugar pyrophosphorylase family protein|nr:nucleotidyltransferase family protein [Candidatus Vecturithrix sp.]